MQHFKLTEIDSIILFREKIKNLRNSWIIKTKKKCYSYQLSFKVNDDNFDFNVPLPREEFIESYLLRLRLFILNKSPINVFHVLNLAYCLASNKKDKEAIALFRKELSSTLYSNFPEKFKEFTSSKNTDELFKLFLNGEYFHLDNELNQKLKSLNITSYRINMFMFLTAIYSFSINLFLVDLILEKILYSSAVL